MFFGSTLSHPRRVRSRYCPRLAAPDFPAKIVWAARTIRKRPGRWRPVCLRALGSKNGSQSVWPRVPLRAQPCRSRAAAGTTEIRPQADLPPSMVSRRKADGLDPTRSGCPGCAAHLTTSVIREAELRDSSLEVCASGSALLLPSPRLGRQVTGHLHLQSPDEFGRHKAVLPRGLMVD